MTAPRRPAIEYLQDMLTFCERIETYMNGIDLDAFLSNPLVQDAVTRNIEILGEAAKQLMKIEPDVAGRFPSIPFRALYGMRNRLIHGYSALRLNTLFQVAIEDVPTLHEDIRKALNFLIP